MSIFELTKSKWDLLEKISKKEITPTQLAKKLGTSIPNISQQLTLLEAKGFLTKKKNLRKEKRVTYKINKERIGIIILGEKPQRKEITQDKETKYIVNLLINEIKNKQELIKLYYDYKELIEKADSLSVFEETTNEIHLLIITKEVEHFRKQSNIEINQKKIIFWSHTHQEILQGQKNQEKYFIEKIKPSHHQKIIEKKTLKQGLKTLFESSEILNE
ncbi:MAG: ArsR/SmtB family transcription factor [Candidatus Woesearchaeota archaeon]